MAESFGAGGPSGSSGVLSSTMRSIVRQAGDPHDRDARRIEDVVQLSPLAAAEQHGNQAPVEPAAEAGRLYNPPSQSQSLQRQEAQSRADEAEEAAREAQAAAREAESDAPVSRPVNIGVAAAIAVGEREMVRRYDVNGDERLDQRERENAIETVQSENTYGHAAGSGPIFRHGGREDSGQTESQGDAVYAEMEARKARAAEQRAEDEAKAEEARANRLAELDARSTATPKAGAGQAYGRSEDLGQPHPIPRGVKA